MAIYNTTSSKTRNNNSKAEQLKRELLIKAKRPIPYSPFKEVLDKKLDSSFEQELRSKRYEAATSSRNSHNYIYPFKGSSYYHSLYTSMMYSGMEIMNVPVPKLARLYVELYKEVEMYQELMKIKGLDFYSINRSPKAGKIRIACRRCGIELEDAPIYSSEAIHISDKRTWDKVMENLSGQQYDNRDWYNEVSINRQVYHNRRTAPRITTTGVNPWSCYRALLEELERPYNEQFDYTKEFNEDYKDQMPWHYKEYAIKLEILRECLKWSTEGYNYEPSPIFSKLDSFDQLEYESGRCSGRSYEDDQALFRIALVFVIGGIVLCVLTKNLAIMYIMWAIGCVFYVLSGADNKRK